MTLDVNPKYIGKIPSNVDAHINATTVFGNKYVAFISPKNPARQHITSNDVINVSSVSTEFNTLFQTVVSIAEKVDPVTLNETLAATAQALDGLGDRFGQSVIHGDEILADVNEQMPQIRYDTQRLADLAEVYADTSPNLWDALANAIVTARSLNEQQVNLDSALMASIGVGNNGADAFERGGPYLIRGRRGPRPVLAAARLLQPRDLVHHPQLRRSGAQGPGGARRRQRLLTEVGGDRSRRR